MSSIELLNIVTYSTSLPFGKFAMSHIFQRIRQFNHAELHIFPASIILVKFKCQVAFFVGVMLFALPVGGVNIWPIGRGIPWGNHGCLPVVTSWYTLQTVYLVCRSFSHSEKLCMGPGPPKLTQDVSKG